MTMGGARSTVTSHPARAEIHAQLKAGVPATTVARLHDLSRQSVDRYRHRHLDGAPAKSSDDRTAMLGQVKSLYSAVVGLVKEAQEAKHPRKFLTAVGEARRCLSLLSKLMGILDAAPAPAVNVAVQVDLGELRACILAALVPHPQARIDVAAALVELDDRTHAGET